jgi:hypothetical protein
MAQAANTRATDEPEILRVFQSNAETKAFYDKISHVYGLLAEHSEGPIRRTGLEKLNARPGEKVLEFFNDQNGERTGFTGLYTAATAGLWYQPKPWLTLRPEVRYDNSEGRAFEGQHGLFTATADVIFRW